MSDELYRKLGTEKPKDLEKDFDKIVELYQQKALALGLSTELKFVKEKGKVLIYTRVW